MYRPLPHHKCTRVLTTLPLEHSTCERLVVRMEVVDVGKIDAFPDTQYDENGYGIDSDDEDEDSGRFDALSYTWGAPLSTPECEAEYGVEHDVQIVVVVDNDQRYDMTIGRNLFEALLHNSAAGQKRPLWVDAICINQNDLQEKTMHILLMSEIYSKAQHVFVWLGKEHASSKDFEHIRWLHTIALDKLEEHIEKNGPLGRNTFAPSDDGDGINVTLDDGFFLLPNESLKALYRFYAHRRYLSRAWVMQEIALAHEAVVVLGQSELPFLSFSSLPGILGDLGGMAGMFTEGDSQSHAPIGSELVVLGANQQQIRSWKVSPMVSDLRLLYGAHDDDSTVLALLEY